MNILGMDQFPDRESIDRVLSECERLVPNVERKQSARRGTLHVLAFEPSTRTRVSMEMAGHYLGLDVVTVSGSEGTSLAKKESLSDTILTHSALDADIIGLRTNFEGGPRFVAEFLQQVPYLSEIGHKTTMINMGDGVHEHPTQCFLDLRTVKQTKGRLDNLTIGLVGDLKYGRTSHSLIQALSRYPNNRFVLISPAEAAMPNEFLIGVNIEYTGDDLTRLSTCDVVYVTRPQVERIKDDYIREMISRWLRITPAVLKYLKPDVVIMHPYPCVNEIDPRIKLDRRFVADRQMRNGLNIRMYLEMQALESFVPLTWEIPFLKPIIDRDITDVSDSTKKNKYFRPIIDNEVGVVIDHIPVNQYNGLLNMLDYYGCLDTTVKTVAWPVNSSVMKDGQKAVILLRQDTMTEDVVAQIAFAVPSATINLFPGDCKRHKIQKCAVPPMVFYFKCGNPSCITNNDTNAVPRLLTDSTGERLTCHYCGQQFPKKDVIRFPL